MQVVVNGEAQSVATDATVADLLGALSLDPRRIAVERNALLVRRAQFGATGLADGDVLEIVTLVGGG